MIERLKRSWRDFKASKPGHRFQDRYSHRQQASHGRWDMRSIVNILLGIAIAAAGLLLIPAPGPGWIITFVGLGLLGSEFAPIARALDWAEVKARVIANWAKERWSHAPLVVKALLVLVAVTGVAGMGYGAYKLIAE